MPDNRQSKLIVFSGLPGVGKSTLARQLARILKACYLRIDSIEDGFYQSCLGLNSVEDAGYRVAWNVAKDNLSGGLAVVADSVNPLNITRAEWQKVAQQSHAQLINVEVYCSDESIHRQRLEQRPSNFTERPKVTWLAVKQRDYEPWSESPGRESLLRLDTAHNSVAANLELLQAHIIGTDQS